MDLVRVTRLDRGEPDSYTTVLGFVFPMVGNHRNARNGLSENGTRNSIDMSVEHLERARCSTELGFVFPVLGDPRNIRNGISKKPTHNSIDYLERARC